MPVFSVERYRDRLTALHAEIEAAGQFACFARRFLIEARRPA